MADKARTRVFHGGKFREVATKPNMNAAHAEKIKLQEAGKKVRVKHIGGKYSVFVKGK